MTPDQQAILDVIIFSGSMGLAALWLAVTEAGRARRQERKVWRQYINLSMKPDTEFVSWEQYRQERLPGHG